MHSEPSSGLGLIILGFIIVWALGVTEDQRLNDRRLNALWDPPEQQLAQREAMR